jgi:hypothetical protein
MIPTTQLARLGGFQKCGKGSGIPWEYKIGQYFPIPRLINEDTTDRPLTMGGVTGDHYQQLMKNGSL